MPANQDLLIRIKQILENGDVLKNLNKELRDTQSEMARLSLEGKKGSTEYKNLASTVQGLTNTKAQLKNEIKALNPELHNTTNAFKQLAGVGSLVKHSLEALGVLEITKELIELGKESFMLAAKNEQLAESYTHTKEETEKFKIAAGGLIDDSALMKIIKYADNIGLTTEEEEKLLKTSRTIAKVQGGEVSETFEKLVKTTDGLNKGIVSLGLSKTKYNELLKQTILNMKGEFEETVNSNGQKEITIKKLSAENQQKVRLEALNRLVAESYGTLSSSMLTNYEKTQALGIAYEEIKEGIGHGLIDALKRLTDTFGITNTKAEDVVKTQEKLKDAFHFVGDAITGAISPMIGFIELLKKGEDWLDRTRKNVEWLDIALRSLANAVVSPAWIDPIVNGIKKIVNAIIDVDKVTNTTGFKILSVLIPGLQALKLFKEGSNSSNDVDEFDNGDGTRGTNPWKQKDVVKDVSPTNNDKKHKQRQQEKKDVDELTKSLIKGIEAKTKELKLDELKEKVMKGIFFANKSGFNTQSKRSDASNNFGGGKDDPQAKAQDLFQVQLDKMKQLFSVVSNVQSSIANMMGLLNVGTDTFVGKMIAGFGTMLNLVSAMVEIIQAVKTASSFFSVLFGFASGGYVSGGGTSTSDSIPARLSNGEYVLNANAVNKLGVPFLNFLNGSSNSSSWLTGGYANGGLVRGMQMQPAIYVNVESEVEKTKAVRFYQNTFSNFTTRQGKKSL